MDPVTDVPSAVTAFTRRMTYGFAAVGRTGQQPRVPAGAEALLRTVFPTLDGKQRTAVLARTEIDSGYPLDSTSDGWQRLNLAAAFSSKVIVSDSGAVIKVEPGRRAEVVVQHDPTIASVRVTAQPTVGVYHAGQEFDPAGLVVTARMSDGTERRLSADEYVLMGFNANATNGPQTITVAVRDERTMTASFTVTITGRAVPDKPTTPAAASSHAETSQIGKSSAKGPNNSTLAGNAGNQPNGMLAHTGSAALPIGMLAVCLSAGGICIVLLKKRNHVA